jgi:hypothetical protein
MKALANINRGVLWILDTRLRHNGTGGPSGGCYLYRAIDSAGATIDFLLSGLHDANTKLICRRASNRGAKQEQPLRFDRRRLQPGRTNPHGESQILPGGRRSLPGRLWLGWALFFGSPGVLVGCLVFWLGANLIILPREERGLEAAFGQAYLQYKNSVPRWLGKTLIPIHFRKHG